MAVDYQIAGLKALITGGSHGIGLAIAEALAREGCHVALCSRSTHRLDTAKRQLAGYGPEVLTVAADVHDKAAIDLVTDTIDAAWGGVDILVNNVGGGGRWGTPSIEETPLAVWDEVLQKNLGATAAFTRWAIPSMRRNKWGRVIAIASIYGKEGGGRPWFAAAKAAQIAAMKSLALTRYLVRDGITFNTVAPGPIMISDTGWAAEQARDPEAFAVRMDTELTLGRLGTPEEVASVVAFLCSRQASLVNGACIVADGGETRSF